MYKRIGPETKLILEELRKLREITEKTNPQLSFENQFNAGPIWKTEKTGSFEYSIYVDSVKQANNAIAMTGSDVDTRINIPFPHKFIRLELMHYTSAPPTISTDALYCLLRRYGLTSPARGGGYLARAYDLTPTNGRVVFNLPSNYKYRAGEYILSLNSTSTDLIVPDLCVERCIS